MPMVKIPRSTVAPRGGHGRTPPPLSPAASLSFPNHGNAHPGWSVASFQPSFLCKRCASPKGSVDDGERHLRLLGLP